MARTTQISKVRLYEQVLEEIYGYIERGEWEPGCKIPSEKELKEQFGVGTAVLRETFRILEAKNIIESRQGQGRFLRNVRPELIFDGAIPQRALTKSSLLDVLDVRISLELSSVEAVITRGSDEQIAALSAVVKLQAEGTPIKPEDSFEACVAKITGNSILTSTIIHMLTLTQELEQKNYLGYEKWQELTNEHELIFRALRDRDLIAARAAVYRHIYGIKSKLIEQNPSISVRKG